MASPESVTDWLRELEGRNDESAKRLVERYFDKLVGIARKEYRTKFGNIPRPVEDEEDAANSAFNSFLAAAVDGRIQDIVNRRQLWALLVMITIRKVYDQRERATAQKRGGTATVKSADALEALVSRLPVPEAASELKDTYCSAMNQLHDPELKRIAQMDLEGRSRSEIAEVLGMTERTVYRKLDLINEKWDALATQWR